MFYTYILLSKKDGKLYIGSTHDLKKRYDQHCNGFVTSTKNRLPLELIHYEAFLASTDAKRREIFLKGGKGHSELKILLQSTYRKIRYNYKY